MTTLFTYVATDSRTGLVLADLPDLDVSTPKCIIGQYQTTTATLPLPTAPEGWRRATLPGAVTVILLAQQSDAFGNPTGTPWPLWGGMVTQRKRTAGDTVTLSLSTAEAYLVRRYVGDVTFTNADQNTVVQSLINSYVLDGANGKPGIPISVVIVGTAGTQMTQSYADASDKTVYSALTELMGRSGGPEWTIGWQHQSSPERYTPVLYVGSRIGTPAQAPLGPAATFEVPGPLAVAELTEDFSATSGATDVLAVSTANGNVRPQSAHQTSSDSIRPLYEFRYTPSTSIVDIPTLNKHAAAALALMSNGSTALAVIADGATSPALGVDWSIGDDVGFVLGGEASDGSDLMPAFPGGLTGTGRAIGWEITLGETWTIAPIVSGVQMGA